MSIGISSRSSRRTLLTAAAGGAAAVVVTAIAGAAPVTAAPDPVVLGSDNNDTNHRTRITNTTGAAFQAIGTNGGTGADGRSDSGIAVYGYSGTGQGVFGESPTTGVYALGADSGTALEAYSAAGTAMSVHTDGGLCVQARNTTNSSPAVLGWSNGGVGLHGFSGAINPTDGPLNTGVYGAASGSSASTGVVGASESGRGGSFSGKLAQLRLAPSSATSHPHSGQKGDFFVDSKTRLWFCKGGTTWKQLA